jgi:hypothetical protein
MATKTVEEKVKLCRPVLESLLNNIADTPAQHDKKL